MDYPIEKLSALMWRNNVKIEGDHDFYCFCKEPSPVPAPSGNEHVIKYWEWYVQPHDVFRLYKKIELRAGDRVSVNILATENACDASVRLMAYSEQDDSEIQSRSITLSERGWQNLFLDIPSDKFTTINLEVIPQKASAPQGTWNGMDGYIDDFKIIR
ncbi:MAG: hypothetical protein IJ644_09750 [Oscillospiraceae bacterium]|nr:hypothetical protein [Oscillospiraceae bacterium]